MSILSSRAAAHGWVTRHVKRPLEVMEKPDDCSLGEVEDAVDAQSDVEFAVTDCGALENTESAADFVLKACDAKSNSAHSTIPTYSHLVSR